MGDAGNLVACKQVTHHPDAFQCYLGDDEGIITAEQATAQSLKCDDCGRLLRDAAAAEFHAVKSGHTNFSESTEAIKPLTEEEKKAKLAELQAKLAAKREEKRRLEAEEVKGREKIRRATGKEMTELKERIKEQEMQKALEAKKREKEEERKAREKIRAQIEADKRERARKVGYLGRQGFDERSTKITVVLSIGRGA